MNGTDWTAAARSRPAALAAAAAGSASLALDSVFPAALFAVAAAARFGGRGPALAVTLCLTAPGLVGLLSRATPSAPWAATAGLLNFALVGLALAGVAGSRRRTRP